MVKNRTGWAPAGLILTCLRLVVPALLFAATQLSPAQAQDQSQATPTKTSPVALVPTQTHMQQGVSIEFNMEPLSSGAETGRMASGLRPAGSAAPELLAGKEALVRFKIRDTNSGQPLGNLRPVAWIDQREPGRVTDARDCREKVQSFLQPGFNKRPSIDLNTYFILALNNEPNISVIDPLLGYGGSKLYTLIGLRSPGEDWVMSADKKRLYVSMPLADQVAVIDTGTWKVIANLDAGTRPTRIALQHDGRYLWIANNDAGKDCDVTVIDTVTSEIAAKLKTGSGPHEIAFAEDDSLVFITNMQDGTLSIISGRKLAKVSDIKVGDQPAAVALSRLSKAIYVANQGDGTIVVVDGARQEIVARMKADPGLHGLRIPDGRFGFVINPTRNTVYVFDVSSNRVVHTVPVGPGADQLAFTREFAYARSTGNEFVTMIKIADLGKEAAVTRFPAGERAPQATASGSSLADAIVPAPEEGAVLVANPADKTIYYYAEGMAAPMGSFQNYRRDPKALLVLDNSLRESSRGVYTTTVRPAAAGRYDVAVLVDAPRVVTCFEVNVAPDPAAPKQAPIAIKIEPLLTETSARVGARFKVRFKVTEAESNLTKANMPDFGVLVFLAPGIWQQREWVKADAEGVYEMSFVPPQAGVYYIYFQCPSLGISFNKLAPLTLQANSTGTTK